MCYLICFFFHIIYRRYLFKPFFFHIIYRRYLFKVAEHSLSAFTDSVSDAIKRALGLWYVNTAVDKVIPQFHMKWIIKVTFDPK